MNDHSCPSDCAAVSPSAAQHAFTPVRQRASKDAKSHGKAGLPSLAFTALCWPHSHTASASRDSTLRRRRANEPPRQPLQTTAAGHAARAWAGQRQLRRGSPRGSACRGRAPRARDRRPQRAPSRTRWAAAGSAQPRCASASSWLCRGPRAAADTPAAPAQRPLCRGKHTAAATDAVSAAFRRETRTRRKAGHKIHTHRGALLLLPRGSCASWRGTCPRATCTPSPRTPRPSRALRRALAWAPTPWRLRREEAAVE